MGRVATAVALCLPCSSFVIPLHAADIAQAKSSGVIAADAHTVTAQPRSAACAADGVAQCGIAAFAARHAYPVAIRKYAKAMPTQATARPERYASAPTAGVCPAPSKPAESRAALKKTQTSSRPSPSITNRTRRTPVRRDGGARQAISGMSQGYRAGSQDSLVFLRSMVARALAYSPELRAASAEVMASDYMVDQVKASACPGTSGCNLAAVDRGRRSPVVIQQ